MLRIVLCVYIIYFVVKIVEALVVQIDNSAKERR